MINIKYAYVSQVDPGSGKVKIDFIELEITSDWIPVLVKQTKDNKHFWLPDVGEHVVAIMDENLERGVVLGSIYSQKNTPGPAAGEGVESAEFSDGTTIRYNRNLGELSIDAVGDVVILCENILLTANSEVILDSPSTTITGDLQVDGEVVADGEVTGGNAIPVNAIGLTTHVHPAGTPTTGPPESPP